MSWSMRFLVLTTTTIILLVTVFVSSLCLRYENYELCGIYGIYNPIATWFLFCISLASVIFIAIGVLIWVFKLGNKKILKENRQEMVVKEYITIDLDKINAENELRNVSSDNIVSDICVDHNQLYYDRSDV